MDNSTLFGMESPIIDFSNMPKYEKRWSNGCNWRKFDQITSNKGRIDGLIDEIYQFIAPKILNDNNGKSCFNGEKIDKICDAKKLNIYHVEKIGVDILIKVKVG